MPGLGEERAGSNCYEHPALFGGDENVLDADIGCVAQHHDCTKCHGIVHFKMVNFISCEFYLNKKSAYMQI